MGFDTLIRNGVKLADKLTDSLQAIVTHEAFVSNDGEGGYVFASPVRMKAIVETKQKMKRNSQGEEIMSSHVITLLRPVTPNGAAGRNEPIDARDRFVIPDGSTGPIISVESITDPRIGRGYYAQVWLA